MTFPALPLETRDPGRFPVVNSPGDLDELRRELDDVRARFGVGQGWSPTLEAATTDPTTSTAEGWRMQVGNLQLLWGRFVIDTSGGGSGVYFVTLPTEAAALTGSGAGQTVGDGYLYDADTSSNRQSVAAYLASSTTIQFVTSDGGSLAHNTPITVAVSDSLSFHVAYPVAGRPS